MNHLGLREKDLEIDLESGGTTNEEDGARDPVSSNRQINRIFNWVWTGRYGFDNMVSGEAVNENMVSLLDKNLGDECKENAAPLEKKSSEGKYKKPNYSKAPKPPRPPKGPSLDAADHKLVREIAELAMRKRTRIERIKALKKMKAMRGSNSCNGLSAMIVTLLFCLIVIFQGFCSRNIGIVRMQGSPAPAVTASESLISVQFYKSFSSHESDGPGPGPGSVSLSVNLAEECVSGSGSREEPDKVAR